MTEQLNTEDQTKRGAIRSFADELSGPSPVSAIAQIAEQIEMASTEPLSEVEKRMGRFPELRGVEVPTGDSVTKGAATGERRLSGASNLSASTPEGDAKSRESAAVSGHGALAGIGSRFDRFPELRDLKLTTGTAARFPELRTDPEAQGVQPQAQGHDYGH